MEYTSNLERKKPKDPMNGENLQINQLSLRYNRLKLKTSGKELIISEEYVEYSSNY